MITTLPSAILVGDAGGAACGAFFLLLLVVAVALSLAVLGRRGRFNRTFLALAQHYRGSFIEADLLNGPPRVAFTANGFGVMVRGGDSDGGGASTTEVQIDWPQAQFQCEIRLGGWRLNRWMPSDYVHTGDSAFDRDFAVRSGQRAETLNFLSPQVRQWIRLLFALHDNAECQVSVRYGRLMVRKAQANGSPQGLIQFVGWCLELHGAALATQSAGIEFVDSIDEVQPLDEVLCPFCRTTIDHDTVYCLRCKTPYHQECWRANHYRCSTYACGGTECSAPRPAGAAPRRPSGLQPPALGGPDVPPQRNRRRRAPRQNGRR